MGICPKITECECPITKDSFEKECLKDWEDCYKHIWKVKTPKEWYEEMKKRNERKKSRIS
jgi:hypothetical protein